MNPQPTYIAAALYKFVSLPDFESLRDPILEICNRCGLKGTVLLAPEGINGTVSGRPNAVEELLAFLRSDPRFADLEVKTSPAKELTFYRMKVRLKKEIVTLGVEGIDPSESVGTYVDPKDWNALIQDPDVVVIDTRNDYEVAIGTFEDAVDPKTDSFRQFPEWFENQAILDKDAKIAMFCTGGIRCEKSTAYLRTLGYKNVYHLKGGILKYLEDVEPEASLWRGECFVFDERVAVSHGLGPGTHTLCRACRHPLSESDRSSPQYEEGISCHRCHELTTEQRRRSLAERMRQVELAEARNVTHIGAVLPSARSAATISADERDDEDSK